MLQPLPVFDRRQRQHLVDHLRQALALRADRGGEARAVGIAARGAFQQFGAAADRRQRALHLVRQRVHVLLDVLLAFEAVAHRFQRLAEVAELARRLRRQVARSPAVTACA